MHSFVCSFVHSFIYYLFIHSFNHTSIHAAVNRGKHLSDGLLHLTIVIGLVRCDQVREQTIVQLNQQFPHVFLSTVMTEMNRICKKAGWPAAPDIPLTPNQKGLQ